MESERLILPLVKFVDIRFKKDLPTCQKESKSEIISLPLLRVWINYFAIYVLSFLFAI